MVLFRSIKLDGVQVQDVLKEYSGPRYEIETQAMVHLSSLVYTFVVSFPNV